MNKNLVVEIFTPVTGPDPGQGVIGTGYPIAKNRILTARHVVLPDNRNPTAPTEIRWRHPQLAAHGWIECAAELAWESPPELDVAVLECEFPPEVLREAWGFLSGAKPADHQDWTGAGFAGAGGRDKKHRNRLVNVLGKTHSMADTEESFELGAEYPADVETGWQGLSGSPVFVHGRIIGVVVTCPADFAAARLRATPAWRLLGDADFRQVVGYDDQQTRRQGFEARLAALLQDSEAVMQALVEGLKPPVQLAGLPLSRQAGDTAARLLNLDVPTILSRCKTAHKSLTFQGRSQDARIVAEVLQLILPAIYDHGIIEAVRTRKYDIDAALLELPAGIRTVAEIIMAGVDRRETRFRGDRERFPEGSYSLPLPPEGGFDADGEAFRQAWHEHLRNKFMPMDADRLRSAWEDYLIGRFSALETRARQRERREYIEAAADELDYRAREDGKTYYFLTDSPADEDSRRNLEALIRQLKKDYPAVMFLQLNDDRKLERSEQRLFRPLCDLLPTDESEDS